MAEPKITPDMTRDQILEILADRLGYAEVALAEAQKQIMGETENDYGEPYTMTLEENLGYAQWKLNTAIHDLHRLGVIRVRNDEGRQ